MEELNYEFAPPTNDRPIIKVIGVGGGGSNAVNHMYRMGIKDVDFYVCNTDNQALESSPVPNKIQLGQKLTEGLGAGADSEKGKNAALESREVIREMLSNNTKMVFVTCGMGGGTGTGASPIIAEIAKEMDILTVGIVTMPFRFEGKPKSKRAEAGIAEMRRHCDTVLVILNQRLQEVYGKASMHEAYSQVDNVLANAAKSIAEIITVAGVINVDFEDVRTVMKNSGAAVMGTAITEGEGRAKRAAEAAITSPLLNNTDISGAQMILISIVAKDANSLTMNELEEITDYVQHQAGDEAEVIFGNAYDESLGEAISVTVIATGFNKKIGGDGNDPKKIVHLDSSHRFRNEPEPKSKESEEDDDFFKSNKKVPLEVLNDLADNDDDIDDNEEETIMPSRIQSGGQGKKPVIVNINDEDDEETPFNFQHKEGNNDKKKTDRDKEWAERSKKLSSVRDKPYSELSEEEIDKFKQPAYVRQGVKLEENQAAKVVDRQLSSYKVSSKKGISNNNSYLHKNTD